MLRGITTFKCDDCGEKFKAPDIEWCATVFSQPMPCPKCKSMHTYPVKSLLGHDFGPDEVYREIWKSLDEEKEK